MLFFVAGPELPSGVPVTLWTSLEAARRHGASEPLVVNPWALGPCRLGPDGTVLVDEVPPEAVVNADPYLPPEGVTAAGGYVVRARTEQPDVVLIYRRGAWDLPKGKIKPGETIEACALREVGEELGAEPLTLLEPVGATVHGYRAGDRYLVKTTHWFLMETEAAAFHPEAGEGITRVGWFSWPIALRLIGYRVLREHMEKVTGPLYQHFGL